MQVKNRKKKSKKTGMIAEPGLKTITETNKQEIQEKP